MMRGALVLVAICVVAQPLEARSKPKRVAPPRLVTLTASPAVTFVKLSAAETDWRLRPIAAPLADVKPMEWRFTGSKVKMKLAF